MPRHTPEGFVQDVFNSPLANPNASDGGDGGTKIPTEAECDEAKMKHSRDMEQLVSPVMTQPITGMPNPDQR